MVVLAFMNLFRDLLKFLKIISIQKFHFGEENMRIWYDYMLFAETEFWKEMILAMVCRNSLGITV